MELGIFAKTFARRSIEETLEAVATHGFKHVQWNMSCAGLDSMPEAINPVLLRRIRFAANARGIAIAALSGTFNMIHPDPGVRRQGLDRLEVLAAACAPLGTRQISLCTGSRDAHDMWRRHPDNDSDAAWSDLLESMRRAIVTAAEYDVMLGIEPERGNVISNAARARRLLDEIDSPLLGIILDPANLIEGIDPALVDATIDDAIALLGARTILAHGKDRGADGSVQPPGSGIVPWPRFIAALESAGYTGPLILHGLDESDVPGAVAALKSTRRPIG